MHPNDWMKQQGYQGLPYTDQFAAFQSDRRALLLRLGVLELPEWQLSGIIKGRVHTVYSEVRRMAEHEAAHCDQLESLPV